MRRAHWGLPDPTALAGGEQEQLAAFQGVMATIRRRVTALLEAPFEPMDEEALDALFKQIGEIG